MAHGLEKLYADLGLVGALHCTHKRPAINHVLLILNMQSRSIFLHRPYQQKFDVELKSSSVVIRNKIR
jgi:hypothetical protein